MSVEAVQDLGVSMVSDWTLLLLVNMFVTIATHYLHHQVITSQRNNCTLQKKRFRLLKPYFDHHSCIPFVCMTHKVQGMLTI